MELKQRAWHGNVRELRNVIEHATILARGELIGVDHLPPHAPPIGPHDAMPSVAAVVRDWAQRQFNSNPEADELYQRMLELVEPPLLEVALEHHRGQQTAAARSLGLHRMTLRKKIKERGN